MSAIERKKGCGHYKPVPVFYRNPGEQTGILFQLRLFQYASVLINSAGLVKENFHSKRVFYPFPFYERVRSV